MSEGRVQRRLAAILAADVVGYTRLMGADETGTLARLKTLLAEISEPEIETHNGRIVKTTGDSVLVECASAVDAAQSAMVMQPALAARPEPYRDAADNEHILDGIHSAGWTPK